MKPISIYAIYNGKGERMYQYGQASFADMTSRLIKAKERYPEAEYEIIN